MELLARLEGHDNIINQAVIFNNEDGVLSISEDRTVRLWLKRERGSYWPSVCHLLLTQPSCMDLDEQSLRLFIGLECGTISEFSITDDYNRIEHKRYFMSHKSRVTGLLYSRPLNILLSVGSDKQFHWNDALMANRLGRFALQHSCTAVQFDPQTNHVFIADDNGQITMLKLESNNTCKHITTMRGHKGSIAVILWEPSNKWLFSAGSDKVITCWDIGNRKGAAYEMRGHKTRITSLYFSKDKKTLLSSSEDFSLVAWNMSAKRSEPPEWSKSDKCERCAKPFFWNFRVMYETKSMGLRRHHCRNCGKAICTDCSSRRITVPELGFEFQVRVCDECFPLFNEANQRSLAKFYRAHQHVNCMNYNEAKKLVLTAGFDKTMTLSALNLPTWS